ncbi:MAG: hypothetical protein Pars92KO_23940 [Parasphingorhabdus sp.]
MKTTEFLGQAKNDLHRIDNELKALESKVKAAGDEQDQWATNQVRKLRADMQVVQTEMDTIAHRIEVDGEAGVEKSKVDAERHWMALKAAVQAYREHVGLADGRGSQPGQ